MKKTAILTLGLLLLATAFVPAGLASRNAYHDYLFREVVDRSDTRFRPFSQRDYAQPSSLAATEGASSGRTYSGQRGSMTLRAFQRSNEVATNREPRERTQARGVFRPSTNRYGRTSSTPERTQVVLRALDDAVENYSSFVKEGAYTVKIPEGWEETSENTFENPLSSEYTLSVERVAEKCSHETFLLCAISLSKGMSYITPVEKLYVESSIMRSSQKRDTVLSEPEKQTGTLTESFVALVRGERIYFSRYFVEAPDGGVYLVEAKFAPENADKYIGVTKEVFDSFRLN